VLDDDQLAVTAQTAARIHHFAGRTGGDRLSARTGNIDPFAIGAFGKSGNQLTPCRQPPLQRIGRTIVGGITGLGRTRCDNCLIGLHPFDFGQCPCGIQQPAHFGLGFCFTHLGHVSGNDRGRLFIDRPFVQRNSQLKLLPDLDRGGIFQTVVFRHFHVIQPVLEGDAVKRLAGLHGVVLDGVARRAHLGCTAGIAVFHDRCLTLSDARATRTQGSGEQ